MLLRCRRGSCLAGALARLSLGVVSERGLDRAAGRELVRALGLWPAWDARICVRALGLQGCCVGYGIPPRTQKRSVWFA